MSDRALIGGVLGGVVGFFVGGPMGAAIGAGIGAGAGILSKPMKIPGIKAGDDERQQERAGTPIGVVLGTCAIKGDLLWQGPRKIIKVKQKSGKGGAPTVENEEVLRDYAIEVCESSELKGTSVHTILMVKENNQIVYDARPDGHLTEADNAKFMENKVFYFGAEDQGADPTAEAVFGAGRVPAYRGKCHMVVTAQKLSKFGNAIPQYEFVVSSGGVVEGEPPPEPLGVIMIGDSSSSGSPAAARSIDGLTWEPANSMPANANSAIGLGSAGEAITVGTSNEVYNVTYDYGETWQQLSFGAGNHSGAGRPIKWNGVWYVPCGLEPTRRSFDNGQTFSVAGTSAVDWRDLAHTTLLVVGGTLWGISDYNETGATFDPGTDVWTERAGAGDIDITASMHADTDGARIVASGTNTSNLRIWYSDDLGDSWTAASFPAAEAQPVFVFFSELLGKWLIGCNDGKILSSGDGAAWTHVFSFPSGFGIAPRSAADAAEVTLICGTEGLLYSTTDGVTFSAVTHSMGDRTLFDIANFDVPDDNSDYVAAVGTELPELPGYYVLEGKAGAVSGTVGLEPIAGAFNVLDSSDLTIGPAAKSGQTEYNDQAFWEARYAEAQAEGLMAPGLTFGVDYPQTVSGGYKVTSTYVSSYASSTTLGQALLTMSARTSIPAETWDVTDVAEVTLRGYAVKAFVPVSQAMDALREFFQFDTPEFDGKLHAVLRGGTDEVVIDEDDVILDRQHASRAKRGQAIEYPKVLHLSYVDPAQDYQVTKQTSKLRSPDVRAKGEEHLQVALTLTADEAAQGVEKLHNLRQDAVEGTVTLTLPRKYLRVVPSTLVRYQGKRYRVVNRRVESGQLHIEEATYDRKSSFVSTAEGTAGEPPTGPGSGLAGPTLFEVMNLPALRDQDDAIGVYVAVAGLLPNWQGAYLEVSRDGGTTWETVREDMTVESTMGTLTAEVLESPFYAIDRFNTLSVTLDEGDLESVTWEELNQRQNPAALLYPDGTAELIQFQDAVELTAGRYELTTLLRGRLNTVPGTFAAGSRFVALDGFYFVPLELSDVGKTLTFRAVSVGTDPENNTTKTLTLGPVLSQEEWPVHDIDWERNATNDLVVEWIGRARLGTDAEPVHSDNFTGYRVTVSDGVTSRSWDTTDQFYLLTSAEQMTVFGNDTFVPTQVTVVPLSSGFSVVSQSVGGTSVPATLVEFEPNTAYEAPHWTEEGGKLKFDPTDNVNGGGRLISNTMIPVSYANGDRFITISALVEGEGESRGRVNMGSISNSGLRSSTAGAYPANGRTGLSINDFPIYPNTVEVSINLSADTDGVNPIYFSDINYTVH